MRTTRLTQILRGRDFPESVTIAEARMLMQGHEPRPSGVTKGRVPTAYVMDQLAQHFGISEQELIDGILNVKKMQDEAVALDVQISNMGEDLTALTKQMPPLVKAEQAGVPAIKTSTLTNKQMEATLKLFGQALSSPEGVLRREATIELRKHVLAGRVRNLQVRVEELIIEGVRPEQAVKQAEQETMSGKLPDVTTDFYSDLTLEM